MVWRQCIYMSRRYLCGNVLPAGQLGFLDNFQDGARTMARSGMCRSEMTRERRPAMMYGLDGDCGRSDGCHLRESARAI